MNEAMHQQPRVMRSDEMQRLLKKYSHGRLGLAFQNEPYVVPVSYGYDQGRIFFHSAKQGKKVDFMRRNNKVCFEVDDEQLRNMGFYVGIIQIEDMTGRCSADFSP